ncbi:hypothetical protein TSUD_245700 [Trifolium subterraneum]|uniref:RNase H type-1 domain-containing protein n=1 Tax=Trifolium subterraneum TaxID=3900 RepID=A0A2Z6PPV9_TRISU|nr:hypothetical protein TSUD_245700 [Trifolium subterraneum]
MLLVVRKVEMNGINHGRMTIILIDRGIMGLWAPRPSRLVTSERLACMSRLQARFGLDSVYVVCQPFAQGGLNLRSLSMLNKATNLKLCWTVLNSQDIWAKLLKARVLRNKRPIQHHSFSSLWSSIKEDFGIVIENSIWSVGNGLDINFWNDSWCDTPLVDLFGIPSHIHPLLVSTVSDYLLNGQWNIPPQLAQAFPNLCNVVNQVTIPLNQSEDHLIWKHTDSGDLLLKDAYHFKLQHFQELHWTKIIWNHDIPPSKSLLVWRIMHNRIPTDENLLIRGCYMPSMCSISSTSLTGSNTSKASSNSIRDFSFLKYFKIEIHHPKQTYLREVCWQPPGADWLKCNIDGASNGNPGLSSCGGIFRNSSSDFVYGFAEPLGVATSFYAELCGAMRAIDLAFQFHWHNVWLETDSVLVVSAFNKPTALVPWQLRNRWKNAIHKAKSMNVIISHIFRESNQVADLLANHGLNVDTICLWHSIPLFAKDSFEKNKLGVPCFRISLV